MAARFPEFAGPPTPAFKLGELEKAVGKTIGSVEIGEVKPRSGQEHRSEAIVLHFTDGSSLALRAGCNARNLGVTAAEFHTDLVPTWNQPPLRGGR